MDNLTRQLDSGAPVWPIRTQCIQGCRHNQSRLTEAQIQHQDEEEKWFQWCERELLGFSAQQPSLVFTGNGPKVQWAAVLRAKIPRWFQRSGHAEKATVTQITTTQPLVTPISECATPWTWKQVGDSSRRPRRAPLLSAENRKRRLQFKQAPQKSDNRRLENVAWSESQFLLWDLDEFGVNNEDALY